MSHFINTYLFINQILSKCAKEIFQKMQFDQVPDTAEDEPPPAKKQHRFADWEDDATCGAASPKPVDDEMTEYLSSRLSDNPDPDSVLQLWKFNTERFPALSKLARFIFSIPAFSAALVSVGAFWKRDARGWDRSRSTTFSVHSNIAK